MQKVSLNDFVKISQFDTFLYNKSSQTGNFNFQDLLQKSKEELIREMLVSELNLVTSEEISRYYLDLFKPTNPEDFKKVYEFIKEVAVCFEGSFDEWGDFELESEDLENFRKGLEEYLTEQYDIFYQ